jgi:hypothetical protein
VTSQFHKFSYVIFGGFLSFETYVSQSLMTLSIGIYDVREEMCATPSSSGFAQFFFSGLPPSIDDCYGSSFLSIWHTDYGHPMKLFFIEILNFWADWTEKIWCILGIFG